MPRAMILAVLAAILLSFGTAGAHGVGMSQLTLHVTGPRITGEFDLHLRDARLALGLDTQVTGETGWLDLRGHEASLREVLARALALDSDGRAFPLVIVATPMEWDPGQSSIKFHLVATCPSEPTRLGIRNDVLFDIDPSHRSYYSVEDDRVIHVGAFRKDQRTARLDLHHFHLWPTVVEFVREGAWHIWSGLDHILFLVALLLPAALVRSGSDWSPRTGLWPTTREVLKVVTAFTLAHSLTLCLSFFGLVRLRAQWVEVAIAASVFAAAWNNLRLFMPGRAWVLALTFGLVHGLGFAGALRNLSLPRHERGLALGTFNVGVELGQLTIVAIVLPLLYLASRRRWYPRIVMGLGSLAIAWMAVVWILERGLGIVFFARP